MTGDVVQGTMEEERREATSVFSLPPSSAHNFHRERDVWVLGSRVSFYRVFSLLM